MSCKHYHEKLFDDLGMIVGDLDSEGYVEHLCDLGHSISHGSFCEDYE